MTSNKIFSCVRGGAFGLLAGLAIVSALPRSATAVDTDRGREIFEKRCTGCHSTDNDKEGPRLRGVYGRVSGSVAGFAYSDGVKKANITWDAESLDKWLTDPDSLVPDNNMGFRLTNADERAAVIAYLKQLSAK